MPPVQAHFLERVIFSQVALKIVVNHNKFWMRSFPIMAKSPGREMQYKKNGVLVVLLGVKKQLWYFLGYSALKGLQEELQ